MLSGATIGKITAVAAAAREVRRVRAETLPNLKGGLRALYRTLELPGANPLKDAHAAKIERHEPVTAPGLPPSFPEPQKLVTEDCIRPPDSPRP